MMSKSPAVTFVVMAGGRGERLWPLVRLDRPKVCLCQDGKRNLLRATIDRLQRAWPKAGWLIVTTEAQAKAVRLCLPTELKRCVLVEPQIKNTAACITLAAAKISRQCPQQVIVAIPADHWISDESAFCRAIRAAIKACVHYDVIATIGVPPTHAHTGFGYLYSGGLLDTSSRERVFRLRRFIEKPSIAFAKRLIKKSAVYWNSGIFVGTAERFIACITKHLPDHARELIPLADAKRAFWAKAANSSYSAIKPISFDHGVMNHLHDGVVIEGNFSWKDLGSLDNWANACNAPAPSLTLEGRNVTVINNENHLVATIGVSDIVIVHTPSATLVSHPHRLQAVRDVVNAISSKPRLRAFL